MHLPSSRFARLRRLGNMSIESFLKNYWQKKPLLIRRAFPQFESPLSPDELAGLSLENESEARLIQQLGDNKWRLEHGPFDIEYFSSLPEKNWTLLVQNLESLEPSINDLLSAFRFIPNWRLDDIMASFSTAGGGVGAHFDYYDVFLLQAEGKRRWRIGQRCDKTSKLVEGQAMQVLAEFNTVHDWHTEAGDLIYIPAQVAHWGETVEDAITYSVGFRAPSHSEFLLDYSESIASQFFEDSRYIDPPSFDSGCRNSGEISAATIQQFRHTLLSAVDDAENIAKWLCEYSTKLKTCIDIQHLPLAFIENNFKVERAKIQLAPFCRAAFYPVNNKTLCGVNGFSFYTSLRLAKKLCQYEPIEYQELSKNEQIVIIKLIQKKVIIESNESQASITTGALEKNETTDN